MNLDEEKKLNKAEENNSAETEENEDLKPAEVDKSGIGKIISFIKYYIFGQPDAYFETKKLLKATEKKLKKITPVIYDTKKETVTPKFARIIYEIYRIVYPAKQIVDIIRNTKSNNLLQIYFVENTLTKEQRKLLTAFSKENITKEVIEKGYNKASKAISKKESSYVKSFNKNAVIEANEKYSALMDLADIIAFDYYPLLKRFNKNLKEDYLVENPSFSNVDGRYIIEYLKGLSGTIDPIEIGSPYVEAGENFAKFKNRTLLPSSDIERLMGIVKKMVKEEYLPLLIKIVDNDPFYRPSESHRTEDVFQNYIKLLNNKIKENLEFAKKEKINVEVKNRLSQLFGRTDINTLKNYNSEKNSMLERLEVGIFAYADPLNYLKYFIMEKYNRYIRETVNSLIVEAKFYQSDNLKKLSNNFYRANELIKEIMKLDESLKESEPRGSRFKLLIRKAGSGDAQSKKLASEYIAQLNSEAKKIIKTAIISMEFIVGILGKISEEAKHKTNQTIISNAKQVQGVRNKEFLEDLVKAVDDMKNITKIMTIYLEAF